MLRLAHLLIVLLFTVRVALAGAVVLCTQADGHVQLEFAAATCCADTCCPQDEEPGADTEGPAVTEACDCEDHVLGHQVATSHRTLDPVCIPLALEDLTVGADFASFAEGSRQANHRAPPPRRSTTVLRC